jgi:hypothetical protein
MALDYCKKFIMVQMAIFKAGFPRKFTEDLIERHETVILDINRIEEMHSCPDMKYHFCIMLESNGCVCDPRFIYVQGSVSDYFSICIERYKERIGY